MATTTTRRIRRRKLTAIAVEHTDAQGVDLDDVRRRICRMILQLRRSFIDRRDEVMMIVLALLSKCHFLFIGDAGTGKTGLVRAVATHIDDATFFDTLLGSFSTLDELVGPVDLAAYQQGVRRRVLDGRAAACEIDFMDEAFKGNDGCLNSLLDIMEGRKFEGQAIPLWTMGGATNWPEIERMDERVAAFYDRFLLRAIVNDVSDDPDADGASDFDRLLEAGEQMDRAPYQANANALVTMDELKAVHDHIMRSVKVSKATRRMLTGLRRRMREQKCKLSPRRAVRLQTVLKASAWLHGRDAVGADDFDAVLFGCWEQRSDFNKARAIIQSIDLQSFQTLTRRIDEQRVKVRAENARGVTLKNSRPVVKEVTDTINSITAELEVSPLRKRSEYTVRQQIEALKKEAKPIGDALRKLVNDVRGSVA